MDRGFGLHRAWLLERLRQAEARINEGQRRIARQREVIGQIESLHEDATVARKLLASYEELHAIHLADRDRLFKSLAGFASDT